MADKIRVIFMDNTWLEMEKPEGFDLQMFTHGMRSIGMILANNVYARADVVKCILIVNDENKVEMHGMPIVPNAPSSETKQ